MITLHTNKGDITLELYEDIAPKTVENFTTHAKDGYYDGIIFHRVIKNFMLQCGDPTGTGMGGESIWGKNFEDEISNEVSFNEPGMLAMANAGPGTNGSQFFITTAPTPWLQGNHTIFGKVVEGMDVVTAIENAPTAAMDKPIEEIKIESVTVSTDAKKKKKKAQPIEVTKKQLKKMIQKEVAKQLKKKK